MAEDFSNYGQEVFLISENTKSLDYILRTIIINYYLLDYLFSYFAFNFLLRKTILQKQSSQFLKIIFFDFCNVSMFLQSAKQQLILI